MTRINFSVSNLMTIAALFLFASTLLFSCGKPDISVNEKYHVAVYPNPCIDAFTVGIGMFSSSTTIFTISLTKDGKEIYKEDFSISSTTGIPIDVLINEPEGAYLLKIEFEDEIEIIKIIKI
ncbi:MAG: hypothetical protein B6I19_08085 [Bacteroidetes bacterium 4572_114]|nr:MAG: hypothetical protein B6I19_08085 [Bacteroidetes bacterium 4572_114]